MPRFLTFNILLILAFVSVTQVHAELEITTAADIATAAAKLDELGGSVVTHANAAGDAGRLSQSLSEYYDLAKQRAKEAGRRVDKSNISLLNIYEEAHNAYEDWGTKLTKSNVAVSDYSKYADDLAKVLASSSDEIVVKGTQKFGEIAAKHGARTVGTWSRVVEARQLFSARTATVFSFGLVGFCAKILVDVNLWRMSQCTSAKDHRVFARACR